jgi:tripartite-type tricarboxylate transporter receptor subunit TctC
MAHSVSPRSNAGPIGSAGLTLVAILAVAAPASAQNWPTRPVTMVVPYAAGGPVDLQGRIMAEGLTEVLHQSVVVENITGAGGTTGIQRVARAAPDGYQFALGGVGNMAFTQTLYKKPLYDSVTDFAPVVLITEQPLVLITRKDLPANNLQEFIAYVKQNASRMRYGSAGVGSAVHFGCALLNATLGVQTTHVPYRGSAPAMPDLIAGRIDYFCDTISTALPHIRGHAVKAIAVLSHARSPALADVPTADEQGLAGFEVNVWNGLFFPTRTPAAIISRLHDATVAVLDASATRDRLEALGIAVVPPERRSAAHLGKFLANEIARWAEVIKTSGVTAD